MIEPPHAIDEEPQVLRLKPAIVGETEGSGSRRWRGHLAGFLLIAFGPLHALPGMLASAPPRPTSLLWLGALVWTLASAGFVAAGLGLWGAPVFYPRWRGLAASATLASLTLLLLARDLAFWPIAVLDLLLLIAIRNPFEVKISRRCRGWRLGWGTALAVWVYGAAATMLRPWHQNWGAKADEIARPMVGDERSTTRIHFINHVVTVEAPPERIWPYLVQIGEDRAGFYSYDILERMAGTRIHNVYEIRPEWQMRQKGDFVRSCPPDWMGGRWKDWTGWKVGKVEPNRLLYLEAWGPMWLEPSPDGTTRFGIRSDIGDIPMWAAPIEVYVFEPIHFLMEQRMLRTIRDLAERNASTPR
ncbi:MAG: hypothetical protein ACO1SV_24685 [Fimbriimonas sp.]